MASDMTVKARVRERDGHKCTRCGKTAAQQFAERGRGLEVHRIVPGSAYTLAGCVTRCRTCHCWEHRSLRQSQPGGRIAFYLKLDRRQTDGVRALVASLPYPVPPSHIMLRAIDLYLAPKGGS